MVAESVSANGSEDPTSSEIDYLSDSETIVRAIMSPWHLDKTRKKLTPVAFTPRDSTDRVSVIRQAHGGDDYCKQKAASLGANHYKGLAAGTVGKVRALGAKDVISTPEGNYPGHADIVNPAPETPEDPPPPEVLKTLSDYYDALVEHFEFHIDPDKTSDKWSGPPLMRSA